MNIAIAITAWRRPDYLRQVLAALSRCYQVTEHDVFITLDGGYPAEQETMLADIAEFRTSTFPDSPERVTTHAFKENQGCAGNVGNAFRHVFLPLTQTPNTNPKPRFSRRASRLANTSGHQRLGSYDAGIFLEDDTVPTPDFLIYMHHLLERFADDPAVFTVSGYAHEGEPGHDLDRPELGIQARQFFTPWGWATWRDRAAPIARDWFGAVDNEKAVDLSGAAYRTAIRETPKGTWDYPMNYYWRAGRNEIAPSVSRIQNIGAERGAFCPGGQWHRQNQFTDNLMSEAQSQHALEIGSHSYLRVAP